MQATARMASVVSSTLPAHRRLIRNVLQKYVHDTRQLDAFDWLAAGEGDPPYP